MINNGMASLDLIYGYHPRPGNQSQANCAAMASSLRSRDIDRPNDLSDTVPILVQAAHIRRTGSEHSEYGSEKNRKREKDFDV